MIIEVSVEGEGAPRRYRVKRWDGRFTAWPRDADGGEGAPIEIDWREPEPSVYSMLVGGRSYEAHVEEHARDEENLAVHLLSRIVRAHASDARKRRIARDAQGPDGIVKLQAPMPGKVLKILAAEGTEVVRGEGVIVLEAMKMENELKAPRDGVVTRVVVSEGEGVEGGAHLATIE